MATINLYFDDLEILNNQNPKQAYLLGYRVCKTKNLPDEFIKYATQRKNGDNDTTAYLKEVIILFLFDPETKLNFIALKRFNKDKELTYKNRLFKKFNIVYTKGTK